MTEWKSWFAWRPVKACGRWHWLTFIERKRDPQCSCIGEVYWDYRAGEAHDYPDGLLVDDKPPGPMHHYTYTCRHCGTEFGI